MKDNRHVESFGQFNENLNISDVRSSKKINEQLENHDEKKDLRKFIATTIREYLNENKTDIFNKDEKLEMIAASVSTKIGHSILKLGFIRTSGSRTHTRFINQYLNGVDILITTQVDFSTNDINVFFKIQLEGSTKTKSTQQDINMINSECTRYLDQIMTDIENGKNNGDFNHLNIDFNLVYFIDKF